MTKKKEEKENPGTAPGEEVIIDLDENGEEEEEPLLIEYFSKDELVEKIKELEQKQEEDKKKIEEFQGWQKKYMLLQAEFENAQKRWSKEKQNLRIEYTASALKKFLPLYDSYKKAVDTNPDDESIAQFYNQFLNIFKFFEGAEPMKVNVNDPFDYHYHEALNSIERDDLPNNTIIDVIQEGWMLGKHVLRYAKVITSREPKPPEPESELEVENEKEAEDSETVEEEKTDNNNSENDKPEEYIS
jgi:molecular chaperone GrpE